MAIPWKVWLDGVPALARAWEGGGAFTAWLVVTDDRLASVMGTLSRRDLRALPVSVVHLGLINNPEFSGLAMTYIRSRGPIFSLSDVPLTRALAINPRYCGEVAPP